MTKIVTKVFSDKEGRKMTGLPGSEHCDLVAKPEWLTVLGRV